MTGYVSKHCFVILTACIWELESLKCEEHQTISCVEDHVNNATTSGAGSWRLLIQLFECSCLTLRALFAVDESHY